MEILSSFGIGVDAAAVQFITTPNLWLGQPLSEFNIVDKEGLSAFIKFNNLLFEREILLQNAPKIESNPDSDFDYRKNLRNMDFRLAGQLKLLDEKNIAVPDMVKNFLRSASLEYLRILSHRDDVAYLESIYGNKENDLLLRLNALIYLKMNNIAVNTDEITQEYENALGEITIKNHFELRASILGMHLLLTKKLDAGYNLDKLQILDRVALGETTIYGLIEKAVIARMSNSKIIANSNMFFASKFISVRGLAHELMHNYFYIVSPFAFHIRNKNIIFSEFLAYVAEKIIYSITGKSEPSDLYFAELNEEEDYVLHPVKLAEEEEEHYAAGKIIGFIRNIYKDIAFSWIELARFALSFARQRGEELEEASQREVLGAFIEQYNAFRKESQAEYIEDGELQAALDAFIGTVSEISGKKLPLLPGVIESGKSIVKTPDASSDASAIVRDLREAVDGDKKVSIAFVCTANKNRSAAADILFRQFLRNSGKNNVDVVSAGIAPHFDGRPLSYELRSVLRQRGVDEDILDSFESDFIGDILKNKIPDYIITVDESHRQHLLKLGEQLGVKLNIVLFSELSPSLPELANGQMPDPETGKISMEDLVVLLDKIFAANFAFAPKPDLTVISSVDERGSGSAAQLPHVAADADAKGLTGAKRAFYAAVREVVPSLLPNFVSRHYIRAGPNGEVILGPTDEEKQTEAYKSRVEGNRWIKGMSLVGLLVVVIPAALASAPLVLPLAVLSTFAFNIITHALYNLSVSKEKRLILPLPENYNFDLESLEKYVEDMIRAHAAEEDNADTGLARSREIIYYDELRETTAELFEQLKYLLGQMRFFSIIRRNLDNPVESQISDIEYVNRKIEAAFFRDAKAKISPKHYDNLDFIWKLKKEERISGKICEWLLRGVNPSKPFGIPNFMIYASGINENPQYNISNFFDRLAAIEKNIGGRSIIDSIPKIILFLARSRNIDITKIDNEYLELFLELEEYADILPVLGRDADNDILEKLKAVKRQAGTITKPVFTLMLLGFDYEQIKAMNYKAITDGNSIIFDSNVSQENPINAVLGDVFVTGKFLPLDKDKKLDEVFEGVNDKPKSEADKKTLKGNALDIMDFYSFFDSRMRGKLFDGRSLDGAVVFGIEKFHGRQQSLVRSPANFWPGFLGMQNWHELVDEFGYGEVNWDYETYKKLFPEVMKKIEARGQPIVFLLPSNFDYMKEGFTAFEFRYLLEHPEMLKNIIFVVGAYDFFDITSSAENVDQSLSMNFLAELLKDHERYAVSSSQHESAGDGVVTRSLGKMLKAFKGNLRRYVSRESVNRSANADGTHKLELPAVAAQADAKGLAGIQRIFYVTLREVVPSLLPGFVSKHYGRAGPSAADRQTDAYKSRVKGNIFIKAMSFAGLSLGIAMPVILAAAPLILPLAVLLSFVLTFAFNIATHAVYNLFVSKDKRLELKLDFVRLLSAMKAQY
ncbi:MAG: hypothetical protein FWC57_03880, partial [Endomicrobia bacterium]|nr:hypothetical protein [Endomicrobiia bacterium]